MIDTRRFAPLLAVAGIALAAGTAAAAELTPAQRCQMLRLKLVAKYASCLLLADAKSVATGSESDRLTCDGRLQQKWAKLQAKYGAECPATNPVEDVEQILQTCTADVLVPPGSYEVVFRLDSASTIGALEFHVDYSSSGGEFAGSGAFVSCTNLLAGSLFAPDDDDTGASLTIGTVTTTPVTGPADLAACTFDRAVYGLPDAADFPIEVGTAIDPGGEPVAASVSIASISANP